MADEKLTREAPPTPGGEGYDKAKAAFEAIRGGTYVARGGEEEDSPNQVPTPVTEEAPEEEPEQEEQAQEQEDKPKAENTKAKDYLRLKTGTPAAALDALSDAELADWERAVRDRETQLDRRLQENADVQKRLEQLEAATKPEERQPASEVDLNALLEPLKEEIGDDGAGKLSAALQKALEPLQASLSTLQADNADLKEKLEQASGAEAQRTLDQQRQRLSSRMELTDRQFRALALEADDIAQSNGTTTWDEAFDKAFANLYGDVAPSTKAQEERDNRESSLPTTKAQRRPQKKKAANPQDRARMVFDAQRKHPDWSKEKLQHYANSIQLKE